MRRLIPVALILALLLAACGAPESGIEGVTAENYPRINGSEDAMPLIQPAFETVHTQYSGGDYPTEALGAEESYEALLAGELDLVIAPYPGEDVLAAAESAGAELEPQALEYGGLYAVTLAGLSEDDPARLVAGWLLSDEAAAEIEPALA